MRGGGGNSAWRPRWNSAWSRWPTTVDDVLELSDAGDVLRWYRDSSPMHPRSSEGSRRSDRPPLPFIPEERHGDTFLAFVSCWTGPVDEGETNLESLRDVAPVVAEFVGPMPYPALNSAFDGLVPPGLEHYWKANFVKELTGRGDRRARDARTGGAGRELDRAHLPDQWGRQRVPPVETAFAYREANFATVIAGMWPDPRENASNTKWVRDYYDATAPHSEGGRVHQLHGRRRSGSDQGQLPRGTTNGWWM